MKAVLAALAAILLVALIAWATSFQSTVTAPTFVGNLTGDVTGNVTGKVTGDADSGIVEADTLGITGFADGVGKPNLLSASVHAGKFATNAAADSLYWSDGTNWQQVAP